MNQKLGRYILQKSLGHGAAGEVYHAVLHGPMGFRRSVALKVLFPFMGEMSKAFQDNLIKEARLGSVLKHPNIVETYEFVINDILGDIVNPVFYNIGSTATVCEDDDALVAPFGCTAAVANFGCDFLWGASTIGDACPESCGLCDDNLDNDCKLDCEGIWGGEAIIDNCRNCVIGNTGKYKCRQL